MDVTLNVADFSSSIVGADNLKLTLAVDHLFDAPEIRGQIKAIDGDISGRRFDQLTAGADGTLKNLTITLQAKGTRLQRFAVDLEGTVAIDEKTEIVLSRFSLEEAALRVRLPQTAHMTMTDDAITLAPMRLLVGSGTVNAQFNLARKTQQVNGRVTLAGLSLGDPADILSSGQTFFDGDINVSGAVTQADATASLTARFKPRDIGGIPIAAKLTAQAKNGRAVIVGSASGLSAEEARLNADVPVKIDLSGPRLTLDMQAPASGDLTWRGEIKPLWQLVGNEQHTLAGIADIDIKAAGMLSEPALTGGIRLSKGLYENLASGTALHNIALDVTAQSGTLVSIALTATDTGAGTIAAQGELRKGDQGWSTDVAGDLRRFHILRRDDITAAANGHVTYKGPVLAGALGGNLQIVKSEYRLGESYQPEVLLLRGLAAKAKPGDGESPIRLDVDLSFPDVFRTEGQGLEAFWNGDIKATGDLNHPNLVGALTLARGTFSFLGKTFDLESGTVTFTGGGRIDPELSIVAMRQAEDITATVTISGRASQPQITLSSQPGLPQDEVLARLLFRKGTTQLGPLESLQLANAAADLAGLSRGGLGGVLRRASGLDIVGFGGQSGNAIVLGRQFSSALYIGIEQNVNDSTRRVVIEWRLTRQFSLQSTTTGGAGADLGVLWRKNY